MYDLAINLLSSKHNILLILTWYKVDIEGFNTNGRFKVLKLFRDMYKHTEDAKHSEFEVAGFRTIGVWILDRCASEVKGRSIESP
jgi:hypothetical protein